MQLMMHLHSNAYLKQMFPLPTEDNKNMAKDHDFANRWQREITTVESPAQKRRWRAKLAVDYAEYIKNKPVEEVPFGKTILPPENDEIEIIE